MKKKILIILSPLCLSLLTGCGAKKYTITFFNSNEESGSILTQSGKYKANDLVEVKAEFVEGYTVSNWTDDLGNKVSGRESFNYIMPNRDVTLTLNYDFAKYKINAIDVVNADEDHYSCDYFERLSLSDFTLNGKKCRASTSEKPTVKWQENVEIEHLLCLADYVSYSCIRDADDNLIGVNTISFEMPKQDVTIKFNYTSKCYGVIVSANINVDNLGIECTNARFGIYRNIPGQKTCEHIIEDCETNVTINTRFYSEQNKYEFVNWIDLDTGEVVSTSASYTVNNLKGLRRFQAIYQEK